MTPPTLIVRKIGAPIGDAHCVPHTPTALVDATRYIANPSTKCAAATEVADGAGPAAWDELPLQPEATNNAETNNTGATRLRAEIGPADSLRHHRLIG
jgi:hypothetical protein